MAEEQRNRKALLGRKLGMSPVWDENGFFVPVTLVDVSTNVVTAVKNQEKDGYQAIQIGYGQIVLSPYPRLAQERAPSRFSGSLRHAQPHPQGQADGRPHGSRHLDRPESDHRLRRCREGRHRHQGCLARAPRRHRPGSFGSEGSLKPWLS